MDDLARDLNIPEIDHMVPIYLRFSRKTIYSGYISIDSEGHCTINWWCSNTLSGGLPTFHTFNSPNRWKRFIQETSKETSDLEGFWDHTFVKTGEKTCTLSSLKYRHLYESRPDRPAILFRFE